MIEFIDEGAVWVVRLNRVDKANSLTAEMLRELVRIAEVAAQSDRLKTLILTGAGDKVFSAGADLEAARAGLATSPLWEQVSGAIAGLNCLTIAALNGTVAGGAFGMVLACDIRLCAPGAKFFYPVVKLGFLPQPSDPKRMRDLIGPARAKLILAAGQKVSAEEALGWGLIDRIEVDPMGAAQAISDSLRDVDPAHLAAVKSTIC